MNQMNGAGDQQIRMRDNNFGAVSDELSVIDDVNANEGVQSDADELFDEMIGGTNNVADDYEVNGFDDRDIDDIDDDSDDDLEYGNDDSGVLNDGYTTENVDPYGRDASIEFGGASADVPVNENVAYPNSPIVEQNIQAENNFVAEQSTPTRVPIRHSENDNVTIPQPVQPTVEGTPLPPTQPQSYTPPVPEHFVPQTAAVPPAMETPQPQPVVQQQPSVQPVEVEDDNMGHLIDEIRRFRSSAPETENLVQFQAEDNVLVIGKDVVFEGEATSKGGVAIVGKVNGKVTCDGAAEVWGSGEVIGSLEANGAVVIHGKVDGIIKGENVKIESAHTVNSNIECSAAYVVKNCVLVGDIKGDAVKISGAVKGNISATNKVLLEATAIVQGDVTAPSIIIEENAVVDGVCKQTGMALSSANFFDAVKE